MTDGRECYRENRNHALRVAVFITFAGPLIGCALFLIIPVFRLMLEDSSQSWSLEGAVNAGEVFLIVVLYAYIFAGLSSLISGAILGWHTFKTGTFGYRRAIVVAIASTLVGSIPVGFIARGQDGAGVGLVFFLIPFAVVSATICRWLMIRIGLLRSLKTTSP